MSGDRGQRRPLVSVNIITWNRLQLLERCIGSILGQTYQNFELVIVDDGSSDGTREYVESIRSTPVQYACVPHSGRISALRNLALGKSSGEYLAFVDSDDAWEPSKLEQQAEQMERNGLAMSFTNARIVGPEGTERQLLVNGHASRYTLNMVPRLFSHWYIYISSVMIRRSLLSSIGGFDESIIATGEVDLMLRIVRDHPAGVILDPLVIRRIHPGQHSSGHWRDAYTEMIRLARRYRDDGYLSFLAHRKALSNMLYRYGGELSASNNPVEARSIFGRSFAANPCNIRAGIRWALP